MSKAKNVVKETGRKASDVVAQRAAPKTDPKIDPTLSVEGMSENPLFKKRIKVLVRNPMKLPAEGTKRLARLEAVLNSGTVEEVEAILGRRAVSRDFALAIREGYIELY